MNRPDELDRLAELLKSLPLIDSADLDQPSAAYDAFGMVASAILQAALIQVPEAERVGKNARLFRRFVVERFPAKRGRGDGTYAKDLWLFRCSFVKENRTGPFALVHGAPNQHLQPASDGRLTLDLESLIADFRAAVDDMVRDLGASLEGARLADELARRTVRILLANDPDSAPSFTRSGTISLRAAAAKAASGTN